MKGRGLQRTWTCDFQELPDKWSADDGYSGCDNNHLRLDRSIGAGGAQARPDWA